MHQLNVQIQIIDSRLTTENLNYGSPGSAGLDLRAMVMEPLHLQPGQCELIGTGFKLYLGNPGLAALILPRSGLGHKGLVLGNLVGLIDSDYQGELKVSCWNRSDKEQVINPMDRIAQLVIVPVLQAQFNVVQSFEQTSRGAGGFGSTGVV